MKNINIGDTILIKAKVINFDSNPHGSSIKVAIEASPDVKVNPHRKDGLELWIHRVEIPEVIVPLKQSKEKIET